ncbi:MAG TPA: hypothetical protein VK536_00975 [Candidatus Limnocylindrales bacterium]|nr:hypothetical protein [Candidatus Limnocylindrales bacterium]
METAVATLLLVTASVVLACVVVGYAVTSLEQTVNTQNIPQMQQLKNFENTLLNQTNVMNGAFQQTPNSPP